MLDVLCGEMELSEYGESIAVGDVVTRVGVRRRGDWFGTGLDAIQLWFDRYVGLVGAGEPLVIGGEVDAIAAVYTRLARGADGAWGPVRGSSSLEPVTTTSETRRPTRRIRWESAASRSAAGGMRGRQELRDGDEQHWGWRFVLVDAHVEDRPDGDQAGADLR